VNKGDRVVGEFIADEKAIWQVVVHYARATSLGKLAPMIYVAAARNSAARPAVSLSKFNVE